MIHPHSLLSGISHETRGGRILRRLCAYHPNPVSISALMDGAGIRPNIEGPVIAAASFAWWVLRINDYLFPVGMKVERLPSGLYGIVSVDAVQEEKVG